MSMKSEEEIRPHEVRMMMAEVERLWKEITDIRQELKEKSAVDNDLREKLMSLEMRFTMLQNEIVKRLDDYREDHKGFLEVYREQFQTEREIAADSDKRKWRLIWVLIAILIAAAGWDITGVSKLILGP